jgi:integrase
LDRHTVRLLREHRRRQRAAQRAAGEAWQDSGYVFVAGDGAPLHPDYLTRRFHHLVGGSGLPPVRLHDLRHGAASLAHCAGVDVKTVQAQLGHSSIVLTADTYTSVLTDLLAYARLRPPPGLSWPPQPTTPAVGTAAAVTRQIRWAGRDGLRETAGDQAFRS